MNPHSRRLQYFFFGQNFADGLRTTVVALVPALVLLYLGQAEAGFVVALGAICVSVTDLPGPLRHRRAGMAVCVAFLLLVALVTGFARLNPYVMGAEVLAFSFLFTMLSVYGARAGAVGAAALLVMLLMMDQPLTAPQVLRYAGLVTLGGLWYLGASLLATRLQPYRPAQRALGECIHAVAEFLRVKAAFYQSGTDLDAAYRNLLAQQVVVNEKQDAVRQILFKSRQLVEETTGVGRALVFAFVETVDLYEHITAIYYDYQSLRARFAATGILSDVAALVLRMAAELDGIGLAVHANRRYVRPTFDLSAELEHLRTRIDALAEQQPGTSTIVLKKVLINLRNMQQEIQALLSYFDPASPTYQQSTDQLEYSRFVSRQNLSLQLLLDNLSPDSSVFRHSVRMGLACLFGFGVAKFVTLGGHSYWIVMTIAFMLKPGFSLTKERNIQRLLGTLGGGAIGVLILTLVEDPQARFGLMVLLMVGAFSFQRTHYVVSVVLMTPYVLILFSLLGLGFMSLLQERVIDTLIGCAIALAAGYLLFPMWESEQLRTYMRDVVRANLNYLQQLADTLAGRPRQLTAYKLARKEVYVSSANLAAAFQRMLSEPKSKRRNSEEIQQFVVLNHILSANIATLTAAVAAARPAVRPPELLRPVQQSLTALTASLQQLGGTPEPPEPAPAANPGTALPAHEQQLLAEQLRFICTVSQDIGKVTASITPEPVKQE
ncbi:FUSC family membrane protein [Hymenobacter sp. B81]|uniref:FUSC family protein n=1 Tax=Hymenobacter sp. B81 TaxID=3344878 RepID=UPI0037DC9940